MQSVQVFQQSAETDSDKRLFSPLEQTCLEDSRSGHISIHTAAAGGLRKVFLPRKLAEGTW